MKCPKCQTDLAIVEEIESGYEVDGYYCIVAGKCETCGHPYLWTQHFKLTNEDGLEDDE